ncbi:hypothetical protein HY497_01245 [Candidatus Woesearchaeota archaeon]|nr:hypothetical protein [Candidatus Woesearchaeota archaeon]
MSSWTEAEAAAYKPRENHYLQSLYEIPGLPPTDPEGRAQFLESELTLTRADRILIKRETKNGRHIGLALLEDLVVAAHEAQATPPDNSRTKSPKPKNI